MFDHRAPDHAGLARHQRDSAARINPLALGLGQLAEGGAAAVEQRLVADLGNPARQPLGIGAFLLVIVKSVGEAARIEQARARLTVSQLGMP